MADAAQIECDPRVFFAVKAASFRAEVKARVHTVATDVGVGVVTALNCMFAPTERITLRHLCLALQVVCQDPCPIMMHGEVASERTRMLPFVEVLSRALADVETHLKSEKYGNIDRRLCRSTLAALKPLRPSLSHTAVVGIAGIIAEVCGVLLHAAVEHVGEKRTMTLQHFDEGCTRYKTAHGKVEEYASLKRFLHHVKITRKAATSCHPKSPPARPVPSANERPRIAVEGKAMTTKKVIDGQRVGIVERPRTPDVCFWD